MCFTNVTFFRGLEIEISAKKDIDESHDGSALFYNCPKCPCNINSNTKIANMQFHHSPLSLLCMFIIFQSE